MNTENHLSLATSKPLTSWTNEPKVADLKADYDNTKPTHDGHVRRIERWRNLLNVTGSAKPREVKGRSSVQPKVIRKQAEWRFPGLSEPLLNNHKLFDVKPVTFEDVKAAEQNSLVLNHQFRTQMNRVKLVDDMVRAQVTEGTLVLRTGWERRTVMVKEMAPVWNYFPVQTEEDFMALEQAAQESQADPRTFKESAPEELQESVRYFLETGQPVIAQPSGTEQEVEVEKILVNRPVVQVMNPENVMIDPTCGGDIDKAMFVIYSFETSYSELVKEPERYKNLDLVDWANLGVINNPDHATSTPQDFQFKDKARKKVVAHEYWGYWDMENDGNLVAFVATWVGDTMIRMEENPFPDGKLPFIVVPYLPELRELYGQADAELLEDNQKIMGALIRGLVDSFGRSAVGQQGFAKGMLDPVNRRRFDNGQDYEFNPNFHPNQHRIEHKYPDIPQSAMLMLNLQQQDVDSMSGTKSFSEGISGAAYGNVATGIRGALDAAGKREMSILRRLAYGMQLLGSRIISMNQVFLSEQEVVRITNSEFVDVAREDLAGNFDLEVDISTAEADAAKAQDLAFVLQTIGPNSDPQVVMKILSEIVRLKRMPDLAKQIEEFKPEPSPEQVAMQEAEVRKAQAEAAEAEAKVQLVYAQIAALQANTQKTGVETMDRVTGRAHAQEMEKQQAQSAGNQELQITKALTTPRKEGESAPDLTAAIGYQQLSSRNAGQAVL